MVFGNICVGWAEGLAITAVTLTARNQAELGTASGTAGSIRFLISSIAQSVYNVILSNRLKQRTAALVPSALIGAGLSASNVTAFMAKLASKKFDSVPGATTEVIEAGLKAYKQANSDAFRTVFLSTIAFTGLAVLLSLMLPNIDKLLSGKVAVTLGGEKEKEKEEKAV
jgi:ABC-type sugar transport system permease subunit